MQSQIGDFDIKHVLGTGAFGQTYKVIRYADQQVYCMKRINITALNPKQQQVAIHEAITLASIDSPYVTGYYDSFIEQGFLLIIMEYCGGGTLATFIEDHKKNKNPLPEAEIWRLFFEIAFGLFKMHSLKIIHRDMKSENVFLSDDGHVKIGDLGVAKQLQTNSYAETVVGTPYYLSPELLRNEKYTNKTDVWALGCILYELATFERPFEANNLQALISKITSEDPAQLSQSGIWKDLSVDCPYSQTLHSIIQLLLRKDHTLRPTIADLFQFPQIVTQANELGFILPEVKKKNTTSPKPSREGTSRSDTRKDEEPNRLAMTSFVPHYPSEQGKQVNLASTSPFTASEKKRSSDDAPPVTPTYEDDFEDLSNDGSEAFPMRRPDETEFEDLAPDESEDQTLSVDYSEKSDRSPKSTPKLKTHTPHTLSTTSNKPDTVNLQASRADKKPKTAPKQEEKKEDDDVLGLSISGTSVTYAHRPSHSSLASSHTPSSSITPTITSATKRAQTGTGGIRNDKKKGSLPTQSPKAKRAATANGTSVKSHNLSKESQDERRMNPRRGQKDSKPSPVLPGADLRDPSSPQSNSPVSSKSPSIGKDRRKMGEGDHSDTVGSTDKPSRIPTLRHSTLRAYSSTSKR